MKGALSAILCVIAFIACNCLQANAQAVVDTSLNRILPDTLPARNAPVLDSPAPDQAAYDSLRKIPKLFQPSPKKSALYSAILPGAGQLYNRQYWKIPIIYAGVGAAIYALTYNSNKYQQYRSAYIARINNPGIQDEYTGKYTQNNLRTLQDAYKKDLDLTTLLTGVGYMLQVMDALAFAHLKNFDVSQNITLKMQPVAMPRGDMGFGLVMNFK